MNYKIFKTDLKPWLKKFFFEKFSYIIKTITGTIITITDGIRKKVNELKLSKLSTQEITTGKNLFDGLWSGSVSTNFIPVEANKPYIYSENDNQSAMNYRFYEDTSSPTYEQTYVAGGSTYTPPTNGYVKLYKSNTTQIKCQLEQGNRVTPYEPYTNGPAPNPSYPQEVKTVKGYRNLLDLTNAQSQESNGVKITVNSDKSITLYGTSTSVITYDVAISDINLSSSKNYLISQSNSYYGSRYAMSLRDSSYAVIDSSCSLDSSKSNKEFTVSTDKVAKYFRIYIPNNVALDTTIYPMILEGTTIKPYVPYGKNYIYTTITDGTNTKYVTIPLNNNEICGIGDYKDELIIDKNGHAKLNKKIGKVVLDGQESWTFSSSSTIKFRLYISNAIDFIDGNQNNAPLVFTNRYQPFAWNSTSSYTNGVTANTNQLKYLCFKNGDITTLEAWETDLATNNIIVYYPLATPTEIDLGTVDMELYEGNNTITNSEDMDMSIKYYSK